MNASQEPGPQGDVCNVCIPAQPVTRASFRKLKSLVSAQSLTLTHPLTSHPGFWKVRFCHTPRGCALTCFLVLRGVINFSVIALICQSLKHWLQQNAPWSPAVTREGEDWGRDEVGLVSLLSTSGRGLAAPPSPEPAGMPVFLLVISAGFEKLIFLS